MQQLTYVLPVQQVKVFRRIPALKLLARFLGGFDRIRVCRVQGHDVESEVEFGHPARVDVVLAVTGGRLVDFAALELAFDVDGPRCSQCQGRAEVHHVVDDIRVVLRWGATTSYLRAKTKGLPVR